MKKLREALAVAIPHYQEICWLMKIVEKADFHLLSQDTIIIYTEFAATMVLGASEKKISSLSSNLNNILKYYFKFRSYPARAIHKMRPLWY